MPWSEGWVTPTWLDYEENVATTFNQTEGFILCVWVFACMIAFAPHACSARGGQKRASDSPALKSQVVVKCQMWVLGTEPRSSAGAGCGHDWGPSLQPPHCSFCLDSLAGTMYAVMPSSN